MPLEILILDDDFNPSLEPNKQKIIPLLVMNRFLTDPKTCGQNCRVTFTESAAKALELMQTRKFDLFICDGNLGEKNQAAGFAYGPELVKKIRQDAARGDIRLPRRVIGWSATLDTLINTDQTCQQGFESLGAACFRKHSYNAGLSEILTELARTAARAESEAPAQEAASTPLRLSNSAPLSLFGRASPTLPSGRALADKRPATPVASH